MGFAVRDLRPPRIDRDFKIRNKSPGRPNNVSRAMPLKTFRGALNARAPGEVSERLEPPAAGSR